MDHSIVFHGDTFIIFGGLSYIDWNSETLLSVIAGFDQKTRTWSKIGELFSARSLHSVIFNGQSFIIFGGQGTDC